MEDTFFKYAIVIVGVVIVTLLMAFAFTASDKTLIVPDDDEQAFQGSAKDSIERIEKLCDKCLTRATNFDCFILDLEVTDNQITQEDFSDNVELSRELDVGKNIIKISYAEVCNVRRLR